MFDGVNPVRIRSLPREAERAQLPGQLIWRWFCQVGGASDFARQPLHARFGPRGSQGPTKVKSDSGLDAPPSSGVDDEIPD